jgi:tetratricopeptide (TPR) repeat protein
MTAQVASARVVDVQRALDAGDLRGALRLCAERLRQAPDDADANRHLGLLHAARGEQVPAMRHARRACELAPDDPRSWSDLGRVLAGDGKFDDAARCFAESIEIDPRHADGWHNLGTALKKLGHREGAFKALRHALLLDSARAETYLNLGNLLIESGQFEDAVECFERAARHDPKLATARSRLAEQLSRRGRVQEAETLFRQSVGLDPGHLQGWYGLGRTLEDLGDAENALACYRQVLARRPQHAQALGQYLALLRGEARAELLEGAQSALRKPELRDEARALIGYGLAKYHDRRGDFAEAAKAALAANAARRRAAGPLDRAALAARVDGLIATYDADFFSSRRRHGLGNDQPVFIVGLPRSGTTLCEQILSSHPRLHGSGELPDLARLAARAVDGTDALPWQAAAQLTEMSSRVFGTRYLRALRNGAPKRRLRISDKSPLNFFQLAFAAVLFPNARVIHCRRDARDNALSIWMENFSPDQGYATDFADLAFFHAQYERLMAHWRQVLPLQMLDLRYEEMVADTEAQARKLAAFLGAAWDARCLDFHRNERAVQTPSRWQVRQPIYIRSVARWRRYAPYLGDLIESFPR